MLKRPFQSQWKQNQGSVHSVVTHEMISDDLLSRNGNQEQEGEIWHTETQLPKEVSHRLHAPTVLSNTVSIKLFILVRHGGAHL